MSGGIDSAVSAMLLREQGYELVGVTFRTYDSIKESCMAREKGCCSVESIFEAKRMATDMGFEHHIVDFRDTFREHVIANFVSEYSHGRTPNPCVLCNSHIKWGVLSDFADQHGCDYIATGHYARIAEREGHTYLRTAADEHKDQTYFLWMLTEEQLRRTIFPLGELTKDRVREIAREHGYIKLSEKKESQEICFVTNNDYRSFLRTEGVTSLPGRYVDAEGHELGKHEGYINYTIGQRKGLGIALGKPVFVTRIDAERNEVVLGDKDDLLTHTMQATDARIRDVAWLRQDPTVQARIRYRSHAVRGVVDLSHYDTTHPTLALHTQEAVWGVTPGQSLVLYKDDLVIGGGLFGSPA